MTRRDSKLKYEAEVTLGKMLQAESKRPGDSWRKYARAASIGQDGELLVADAKSMWFSEAESAELDLRRGDVLVVEGGDAGRSVQLNQDLPGWGFQNSVNRVRSNAQNDSRFVFYALQSARQIGLLRSLCDVVSIPHLTAEKLKRLPLSLPDLLEQRAIADYLDRETVQIDTLIAKQEQLIATLRERRASTVWQLLNEDRVAPIDKLGRRARIGNGSTPHRDNANYWAAAGMPWLNSSVVNESRVATSSQFVTATALNECHLPIVQPGSLLIGLTGQGRTRGMATILDIEATVSQHIAYIKPDPQYWDSEYLLWALRARYEILRALSDENGSTKGGLTCAELKEVRLPAPNLSTQRRIAAELNRRLEGVASLIAKAERFIELAKERRAALITAAVTGQVDVRSV